MIHWINVKWLTHTLICSTTSTWKRRDNNLLVIIQWQWLLTSSQGWYRMKNQNPSYFIKRSCIAHANPRNVCCDFPFFEKFFAATITGKSKQHFDCCSIILKFNVEGKKLSKLYRYIYKGRENEEKYALIPVDIKGC